MSDRKIGPEEKPEDERETSENRGDSTEKKVRKSLIKKILSIFVSETVYVPTNAEGELPKSKESWTETFKTIFYALVIALFVRTFAYEPFNIPSGSMYPTLMVGDYLFVSKLSYGYSRYSFPYGDRIFGKLFEGRIFADEPERGDVIVFRKPTDTSIDYIKRLIGLPGDTVQVIGGVLHINGKAVERRMIGEAIGYNEAGFPYRVTEYEETLPGGVTHRIWEMSDQEYLDNTPPFVVPEGHYFFMGDNRDNSQDSRVRRAVGMVPAENLIGRAEVLFFSFDGRADGWFDKIRFGRLGNSID